jgi:hypothetical protein
MGMPRGAHVCKVDADAEGVNRRHNSQLIDGSDNIPSDFAKNGDAPHFARQSALVLLLRMKPYPLPLLR